MSTCGFLTLKSCCSWRTYFSNGRCHGLNVCVGLKFICWKSNAQGDIIMRWGLWEVMRSQCGALLNGISSLVAQQERVPANLGDSGDMGSIPGSGRYTGRGHGNPLQYSWLGNLIDRGAWKATVHRAAKSRTWLQWTGHARKKGPRELTIPSSMWEKIRNGALAQPCWYPDLDLQNTELQEIHLCCL